MTHTIQYRCSQCAAVMTSEPAEVGSFVYCPHCHTQNQVPQQSTEIPQAQSARPKNWPSLGMIIAIALFVLVVAIEGVALYLLINESTATHESASFRSFHWGVRNDLVPKYIEADHNAEELDWKTLLEIHRVIGKKLKLMEFQNGTVAALHQKFLDHNEEISKLCLDQVSAANNDQTGNTDEMKKLESKMADLIVDFDKLAEKYGLRKFKEIEAIYKGESRENDSQNKSERLR